MFSRRSPYLFGTLNLTRYRNELRVVEMEWQPRGYSQRAASCFVRGLEIRLYGSYCHGWLDRKTRGNAELADGNDGKSAVANRRAANKNGDGAKKT